MLNKIRRFVKPFLRRNSAKYSTALHSSPEILNGIVAYNEYGGYFTPISSQQRPAVQQVLKGAVYEPKTIEFMRNNCLEGDIIHAGTFFGDFLPGLSSNMAKDAKIWAFEPSFESYRCAQITALINNLMNVELINAGLGNETTSMPMLIESEAGVSLGGASKIVKGKTLGKIIDIDIVKIDDIIPLEREISIIQLDVEGYEKEALEGAINTINVASHCFY